MSLSHAKESILIFLFVIVFVASGLDLIADLSHGADTAHIIKEGLLVLLALAATLWLLFEIRSQAHKIEALVKELSIADVNQKKAEQYMIEGRQQLRNVIQQQFQDWHLTQSEAEVGMLLLKGLSQKEIAALRNTAEKTVRQQASSIYKKSDTSGRHAFSAWFIEDIL